MCNPELNIVGIRNKVQGIRRIHFKSFKSLLSNILYLIPCTLYLIPSYLQAQQPTQQELNESLNASVKVIARRYSDSVVLRWSPTKAQVWKEGLGTGYTIERAPLLSGNKTGSFIPLNGGAPVKPWTEDKWQPVLAAKEGDNTTSYEKIAFTLLYSDSVGTFLGNSNPVDPDDIKGVRDLKSQFEMRFAFVLIAAERSVEAADGLGLRYVDRTAAAGTSYVYRVSFAGKSKLYTVSPGEVQVGTTVYKQNKLKDAVKPDEQDRAVMIRWRAVQTYSAFHIERSDDDGKSFRRITPLPVMTLRAVRTPYDIDSYLDSGLTNYKKYIYRVIGLTSFADEEQIGEVSAMPRDKTGPGMPTDVHADHIPPKHVRISWKMDEPVASDLEGFYISTDSSDDGKHRIRKGSKLSPSIRTYTDELDPKSPRQYYFVDAVDTAGNISQSFSAYVALEDSTPPGKPGWVKGVMDTNGVVRLQFRANPELDIMGYRLLRANSTEHEFSVVKEWFGNDTVTTARDTLKTDTVAIRTLTKFVYYRLIALDWHFNESEVSEVLIVPRPDVIPPTRPLITDIRSTDSSIVLSYQPSSSRDNWRHVVYRRLGGKEKWDSIATSGRLDSVFTDKTIESKVEYEYGMRAVDSSGLKSEWSNFVSARTYRFTSCPPVTNLKATYDSVNKQVRLQWDYQPKEGVRFIIYRGVDNDPPTSYQLIKDKNARVFTDRVPSGAMAVRFTVKVVGDSGAESRMSEIVVVKVR